MNKSFLISLFFLFISIAEAQFATVGAGVLVSDLPLQPVAELNAQTPPFFESRAYLTMSWTDESAKPTFITALERSVLQIDDSFTSNVGVGLLWLEYNNYKPFTMLVSSTNIPLSIPKTSVVIIGSVLPFQDFEWSAVLKLGFAFWFRS